MVRKTDGCWEWTGRRDRQGYGRLRMNGKECLAHRVAWELTRGPIPEGMKVCHSCDNPPCIRPDHLWLGTQRDNVLDMEHKGRAVHVRGQHQGSAKLTEKQVLRIRIRCANGEGRRKLAREYGVSHTNVELIVCGRAWKSLPLAV